MGKYPVVTPNVQRVQCVSQDAIDVSLGGAIAVNDLTKDPLVINMNGDVGFLFVWGAYVALLRVKTDGQFCWYSNTTFVNFRSTLGGSNISIANFIGNGIVQVTSNGIGGLHSLVIPFPIQFVNGGWLNLQTQTFAFPPCPCGGGRPLNQVYYDAVRDYMLCTYTQGFANAYNLWAGVYKVSYGNYSVINQGYCGNFNNGTDPIASKSDFSKVQGGLTYGTGNNTFSFDQQGNFIGRDVEFTDMLGQFFVIGGVEIIPGELDCSGNSTNYPAYKLTINSILDQSNPVFAGYNFQLQPSSLTTSACDIKNVICASNQYHSMVLYNNKNFVELYNIAPLWYANGHAFLSGTVITLVQHFNQPSAPPYNAQIFLSTPSGPLLPLDPPPQVNQSIFTPVLNWHRPISIKGIFKT